MGLAPKVWGSTSLARYKNLTTKTQWQTIKDIDEAIREKYGYEWSFYGMKKSDGLNRRMMLKDYELEAISTTNRVYPLSAWKQGDVLAYIQSKGLPMPISYTSKKKSQGLGFNIDCFLYLHQNPSVWWISQPTVLWAISLWIMLSVSNRLQVIIRMAK